MAANIYKNISENKRKTFLLMFFFTAFVLLVAYFVADYLQSELVLLFAGVGALISNFTAFWFSDKIALKSSGAIPADEKEYRELHRILENLAITAGLPKPKLYIIPDPAPNAFATGRDPEHASVAVTSGLLDMLDRSELEGVLAHELSHIGNRDILVMSVAVVLVGFLGLLIDWAWRISWSAHSDGKRNPIFAFFLFVAIIFAPVVAKLAQFAISRKREFLADASGALLTRYPEGLANALLKISSYKSPMRHASTATAHLFISNPFGNSPQKSTSSWYANIFSTHPPVKERVEALLGKKYLQNDDFEG